MSEPQNPCRDAPERRIQRRKLSPRGRDGIESAPEDDSVASYARRSRAAAAPVRVAFVRWIDNRPYRTRSLRRDWHKEQLYLKSVCEEWVGRMTQADGFCLS